MDTQTPTHTKPFEAMGETDRTALLERLNAMEPGPLLKWVAENHGDRAGIVTSFQNTGCVTIDISRKVQAPLRVLTVDTLRLHPETYELIDRIERHYGIRIERFKPDPKRLEKMVSQHGEFLFFDSKSKQEYCCSIRKIEPNRRALQSVDVWITGLRRDQSDGRSQIEKASFSKAQDRSILKIAPLCDWTAERIHDYIEENGVPYNALYDRGFTSIGCTICSTPTMPWEDKRAGRWRWQQEESASKECGMHTEGGGI